MGAGYLLRLKQGLVTRERYLKRYEDKVKKYEDIINPLKDEIQKQKQTILTYETVHKQISKPKLKTTKPK